MVSAEGLYYCATLLLYTALADEYFLYDPEDIPVPNRIIPQGPDWENHDAILNWAFEEHYLVPDDAVPDINSEEWMDSFTEHFIPPLWDTARQAHSMFPQIEGWQCLSYLYYNSAASILQEFRQIMQAEPIRSSAFYEHFDQQAQRIEKLHQNLHSHQPQEITDFVDTVEQFSKRTGELWHRHVVKSASGADV